MTSFLPMKHGGLLSLGLILGSLGQALGQVVVDNSFGAGGALAGPNFQIPDTLGKAVFAPDIQIYERPHVPGAMGSAPFDEEGVRTREREVVRDGVVEGYFLSTYSARKLGMQTTGNAGGACTETLRAVFKWRGT